MNKLALAFASLELKVMPMKGLEVFKAQFETKQKKSVSFLLEISILDVF